MGRGLMERNDASDPLSFLVACWLAAVVLVDSGACAERSMGAGAGDVV